MRMRRHNHQKVANRVIFKYRCTVSVENKVVKNSRAPIAHKGLIRCSMTSKISAPLCPGIDRLEKIAFSGVFVKHHASTGTSVTQHASAIISKCPSSSPKLSRLKLPLIQHLQLLPDSPQFISLFQLDFLQQPDVLLLQFQEFFFQLFVPRVQNEDLE